MKPDIALFGAFGSFFFFCFFFFEPSSAPSLDFFLAGALEAEGSFLASFFPGFWKWKLSEHIECKCIFNSRVLKKNCRPLFHLHLHFRQNHPHLNHQLENPHHPCQQQNLNPTTTKPNYMDPDMNIKRQI